MSRRVIIGGRDLTAHIHSVVALAPPLKPQQLAQLRLLLMPASADSPTMAAPASRRTAARPHTSPTSPDVASQAA